MKDINPRTGEEWTDAEKSMMLLKIRIRKELDDGRKLRDKADHRHVWKGQPKQRFIGYFSVHCGVKGCNTLKAFYGKQGDYLC